MQCRGFCTGLKLFKFTFRIRRSSTTQHNTTQVPPGKELLASYGQDTDYIVHMDAPDSMSCSSASGEEAMRLSSEVKKYVHYFCSVGEVARLLRGGG